MRRSRGFTLLELLLVMAVLGVVMGMAGFVSMHNPQRLAVQEAQLFLRFFEHARAHALISGQTLGIQVNQDGYRMMRLTHLGWRAGGDLQPSELDLRLKHTDWSPVVPDGLVQLVLVDDEEHTPFILYFRRAGELLACVTSDGINLHVGC